MSEVAKLSVAIEIDKNSSDIQSQVKAAVKEMQKAANGTEINLKYKGDASQVEQSLKELEKHLSKLNDNLKINIDLGNIKGSTEELKIFKDNVTQVFNQLSKGSNLTFGGFNTDDLTTEIKQVEKELEKAQKKLTELNKIKSTSTENKSLKEYIKEIQTLERSLDNLDEKSYDKAGKNLLTLVEEFKRAGGSVSELGDSVNGTLKALKEYGLKPNKIKIVDDKAIKEQEHLIESLQNKLENLKEKTSTTAVTQTVSNSNINSQEVEKLNVELEEQKQKTIAINEQLHEQRKLYSELEDKNKALQNQLDNSVGTEAYVELKKTLTEVTIQLEEARNKASELESELASEFTYTNSLNKKISELERGEVVSKSEYDNASTVIEYYSKTIDEQKESISKLEGKTNELEQANKKLTNSNSELLTENATLTSRIEEQKNALDTVNQQIKENEATIESYRSAIETTSNALAECQEKLKQFSFDPFEQAMKQMYQFNDTNDTKHFDKAASYYGIYQEQGGQNKAIINEVDITDKLIARYKELQKINAMATPEIIAKLNAINKETFALNEQREVIEKNIKALEKEEKVEREVAKAAEKATVSNKTKTSSSVDDENKVKRANSLLTKIKAAQKAQDAQTVSTEKTTQAQKEQTKAVKETGKALKENKKAKSKESTDNLSQSFEKEKQIVEKVVSAEKESLNILSQKITEVIADVDRKTQAFREESQVVDGTVQSEINALAVLSGWLLSLKDDVEKLSASFSSISNIEIKVSSNLNEIFKDINKDDLNNKFKGLSQITSLNRINVDNFEKKLSKLSESLNKFGNDLKGLEINDSNILSSIQSILNEGKKLEQLASVLKSSKREIKEAQKAVNDSGKSKDKTSTKKQTDTETKRNKELKKIYNDAYKAASEFYVLQNKINGGDPLTQKERDEYNKLKHAIDEAVNSKKEYDNIMQKGLGSEKSRNALSESFSNFNDNSLNKYLDNIRSTVEKASKELNKFGVNKRGLQYIEELNNKCKELERIINLVSSKDFKINSEDEIKDIEKLKAEIEELTQYIKNGKNNNTFMLFDAEEVNKQIAAINKTLRKNTALTESAEGRSLIEKYKDLELKYKLIIDTGGSEAEVKNLNIELSKLDAELQKTGKTGSSVLNTLGTKIKNLSLNFVATFLSLYDIVRYMREAANTVREFNTALTEMRKVSDESVTSLRNFQSESFKIGSTVGTTGLQIQQSTADFLRLGESFEQAQISAVEANKLLNVSEFESIDEATESLISMSQAYSELGKGEIIDVLNKLGNEYPIATDGLATALQNSASALKTANNDLHEAAALTTAANAVVQDPDKVGAGLRTIALRLTGTEAAKEELESLGEDVSDFQVSTTSKLDEQIKSLTKTQDGFGVSLLDMNGNYRSTYEVLLDIAKVWDQIKEEDSKTGENRQNALLEMMANTSLYVQKCA